MQGNKKKCMWLVLLQYSLSCGGLEPNPQYLRGLPILRKNWNFSGFFGKLKIPHTGSFKTSCLLLPPLTTFHLPFRSLASFDMSPFKPLPPQSLCPSYQTFPFPLPPPNSLQALDFWASCPHQGLARDSGTSKSNQLKLKRKKS